MTTQKDIPRDKTLEGAFSLLLTDGYEFIGKRCRRYHSDIFQTRLMFKTTICMSGEHAARLFYNDKLFTRKKAVPGRIKKSLFGKGGVQVLNGEAHRHRKKMFMSLMGPEKIKDILNLTAIQWQNYIQRWERMEEFCLYEQVQEIFCRAVCDWAGVPLIEKEVKDRAKDFGAMVDAFGAVGPRHWRGRRARNRAEKWIIDIIEQVRDGKLIVKEDCPAYLIAFHRDIDGHLLNKQTAAVELINLLRPTVAIARFITFAALALHKHPEYRQKLQEADDNFVEMFVQEVRRHYPFAPFLGALVQEDFQWNGYRFKKGRLVLLDLFGTNHDSRIWENPQKFRPERFLNWEGNPYNLIPQGGGDHYTGHRCAGEWITIAQMKLAMKFLTREIRYEVPEQDLTLSLTRIPAMPKSGFVIKNVNKKGNY